MAGVFINYRRDDARSEAGRLFDWLSQYFGRDQVFMDVSGSIEPGLEFDRVIENAVSACEVLIVVIGKEWLTAMDEKGKRRLDDPNDFVRLEIAAALKRNIRVIPVLVEGAAMPEESDLPDDLKRLSRRQASELSDNRWEFDTRQLVKVLEKIGVKVGPVPNVISNDVKQDSKVTKKTSKKAIFSLGLGVLMMSTFSEPDFDQDTKIGLIFFSIIVLGLSISAYYDVKNNPSFSGEKNNALAIVAMFFAGLLTLATIGTLREPEPSVPIVAPQASSPNSLASAPAVKASPASHNIDVTGTWRGADGIYIFQQSGSNIGVQLFGWNEVLIAQATGQIAQSMVAITYVRIDSTRGEARFQVSADGRQMAGTYKDLDTGEAGPITLVR